jgi:hypothetical protein
MQALFWGFPSGQTAGLITPHMDLTMGLMAPLSSGAGEDTTSMGTALGMVESEVAATIAVNAVGLGKWGRLDCRRDLRVPLRLGGTVFRRKKVDQ